MHWAVSALYKSLAPYLHMISIVKTGDKGEGGLKFSIFLDGPTALPVI